ncbi:MAG: hypothetical protein RMI91_07615 [Gemmatales bacterium]|nr:hypothetical protein [Gemmatales bacterium]MDW7994507.1 hypothetical protein [Gemmatales bacterium]
MTDRWLRPWIGLLELALLTAVCLGMGVLAVLVLSQNRVIPSLPAITAIALVLIPALLAHAVALGASRTPQATVTSALAGTGIRLIVTLGGSVVVVLAVSWGSNLGFWMPLMASYLGVLIIELLFALRRVAPPQ